jgi:potassium/hydrogen antiporter
VGLLFGAIISATDPATLVPLFRFNRIDQDTETLIVTESIFNDPLGIVLTLLVLALILPGAQTSMSMQLIGAHTGPLSGALLYFLLYIGLVSVLLGLGLGSAIHWLGERFAMQEFAVLMGLSTALGGFVLGSSGYLVATIIGLVMGNHLHFFPGESDRQSQRMDGFLAASGDFKNLASALATVLIFVLLGASLELTQLSHGLLPALLLTLLILFLVRPLAVIPLLLPAGWSPKRALFVALEDPRGVGRSLNRNAPGSGQAVSHQLAVALGSNHPQ